MEVQGWSEEVRQLAEISSEVAKIAFSILNSFVLPQKWSFYFISQNPFLTLVLYLFICNLILLIADIILSIDYEYASMNFLPFDIGNHFCEYAGMLHVTWPQQGISKHASDHQNSSGHLMVCCWLLWSK